MSEDLRHIVEQSFADEETQAEKTPEEIRSQTLETIDIAKKLLEEVKNSQGEDSEFYQKALKEYEGVQSQTVKLLPETLQLEELEKLKKEVSDVEKVSSRSQQDIRVMHLLMEKEDISKFTDEDIKFIGVNGEKYMRYIGTAGLLLDMYKSKIIDESDIPFDYQYLNETLKNDKRIVKLLVENFEDSGKEGYMRMDNMLTKDFKSDIQNIIFVAQSFPSKSKGSKNIFISEYLQYHSSEENIQILADNCKAMGILKSELRDMLPTYFIEEHMNFMGKNFGPLDREFTRRFSLRKQNLENAITALENGDFTLEKFQILNSLLRKEDLGKQAKIRERVIQLCVSGDTTIVASLTSIHNSSDIMGQIIRQTKGYFLLEFVADDVRNNKFFLRRIASTKKDFEEVLDYISQYVTNQKTIDFLKQQAETLGVDIEKTSPNLIAPDRSTVRKRWEQQEQRQKSEESKKVDSNKTSTIQEEKNYSRKTLSSLGLNPEEEKTLTPEELRAISESETVKENFLGFKALMEELNLGDIWSYRNDIFKAVSGGNTLSFNIQDGDYLSENEIKIFVANVIYSIKDGLDESEQRKVEQLKGGKLTLEETKVILMQINRVGPIVGQENNGKLLNARSRVGGFFQEKFIDRDSAVTFKMGEFQKALKQ